MGQRALEASGWPTWLPALGVEGATLLLSNLLRWNGPLPFLCGDDKNLGQR